MKRSGIKNKGTSLKRSSIKISVSSLNSGGVIKSKKSSINRKSESQRSVELKYNEIKKEFFTEEMLCTGCESNMSSTPSHLVPRNRGRLLVADIRNIKPHCHVCHPKWESSERIHLLDYKENMEAIKEMDPEYYRMLKRDEL